MAREQLTPEQAAHWDWIRWNLPCAVCPAPIEELHHAYGPSMQERGIHKGMGQRTSHWLVLPLCHDHHQGKNGIHRLGVRAWERTFRPQAELLDELGERAGRDLFALAAGEDA